MLLFIFFFNDTATTEIYTLSLHDALPICPFERERILFVEHAQADAEIVKRVLLTQGLRGMRIGIVLQENRIHAAVRSEEHTSELQSPDHLVCRLLLEKKKTRHRSLRKDNI